MIPTCEKVSSFLEGGCVDLMGNMKITAITAIIIVAFVSCGKRSLTNKAGNEPSGRQDENNHMTTENHQGPPELTSANTEYYDDSDVVQLEKNKESLLLEISEKKLKSLNVDCKTRKAKFRRDTMGNIVVVYPPPNKSRAGDFVIVINSRNEIVRCIIGR